jgi:hypothetical protein
MRLRKGWDLVTCLVVAALELPFGDFDRVFGIRVMKGFSYVLILVLKPVCLSFDDLLVKPCILQHSFAVVNAWGLELWVCDVPVVDVLEQDFLSLIKIVLNLLKTGNSALNEVMLLVDRYETGYEVRILEAAKRFGEGNILLDLVKLCAGLEDDSSASFG